MQLTIYATLRVYLKIPLRLFLSIVLRIPTAQDCRVISARKWARENERVHVHNVKRDFPLARLNSEIIACFLLNENGDLYFLLHDNSVYAILLN